MMGWDMIMSKSGLFCLNLSLCEKGCGIIRIPWKAKQIPSLGQLGGITASKVQQTYQFKQGLGISFQHSEFLASDSCAGDSLESQPIIRLFTTRWTAIDQLCNGPPKNLTSYEGTITSIEAFSDVIIGLASS
jgi:hypothetical protein